MINLVVWADQEEFNASLRPEPPTTDEAKIALTKDFSLHMMTEISEMLAACGTWQSHRRRTPTTINEENIRRQLIDQFKYWMTLCQLWGFTPDQMEATYWRKSATVRARYSEEFLLSLDRPACILDLDNVLVDYTTGFSTWAEAKVRDGFLLRSHEGSMLTTDDAVARIHLVRDKRMFFSAKNVGVDLGDWMTLQHEFRVGGGFGQLPPCDGLAQFAVWLAAQDLAVIGLTSRSVDTYPNIIDDTLFWLDKYGVKMDCVWWGAHKGEKLKEAMPNTDFIRFVVDDDPRYLGQYAALGLKRIYWIKGMPGFADYPGVIPVSSLYDIINLESEVPKHGDQR